MPERTKRGRYPLPRATHTVAARLKRDDKPSQGYSLHITEDDELAGPNSSQKIISEKLLWARNTWAIVVEVAFQAGPRVLVFHQASVFAVWV